MITGRIITLLLLALLQFLGGGAAGSPPDEYTYSKLDNRATAVVTQASVTNPLAE